MSSDTNIDKMPKLVPAKSELIVDPVSGFQFTIEFVSDKFVSFDPTKYGEYHASGKNVRSKANFEDGVRQLVPAMRSSKGKSKDMPSYNLDPATGEIRIIAGHIRAGVRAVLRREDPTERGYQGATVKLFRGLSDADIRRLMMDHNMDQHPLDKVDSYTGSYKGWRALGVGPTSKEMVKCMRNELKRFTPSGHKNDGLPDDDKKVLSQFRGVLDTWNRASSIKPVDEALIKSYEGKQKWPTNDEINEAYSAFLQDKEGVQLLDKNGIKQTDAEGKPVWSTTELNDGTKHVTVPHPNIGYLSPENEPEKCRLFLDKWNKTVGIRMAADASGGATVARGTTSVTAQQWAAFQLQSSTLRAVQSAVARKGGIPQDAITRIIDPFLVRLEALPGGRGLLNEMESQLFPPVANMEPLEPVDAPETPELAKIIPPLPENEPEEARPIEAFKPVESPVKPVETPKVDVKPVETPKVDVKPVETPKVEIPAAKTETPKADVKPVEAAKPAAPVAPAPESARHKKHGR